jgi:hypothetical protein
MNACNVLVKYGVWAGVLGGVWPAGVLGGVWPAGVLGGVWPAGVFVGVWPGVLDRCVAWGFRWCVTWG